MNSEFLISIEHQQTPITFYPSLPNLSIFPHDLLLNLFNIPRVPPLVPQFNCINTWFTMVSMSMKDVSRAFASSEKDVFEVIKMGQVLKFWAVAALPQIAVGNINAGRCFVKGMA